MPGDAKLIAPGCALAYSMKSETVRNGREGLISMIFGERMILATGMTSLIKL